MGTEGNMTPAELQSQILAFVLYSIPLVAALWKIFAWLDSIQDRLERQIREVDTRLTELDHRSQLRTAQIEALNDKIALSLNGVQEVAGHLRTRTKADHEALERRLSQLESYLVKTTDFQARN